MNAKNMSKNVLGFQYPHSEEQIGFCAELNINLKDSHGENVSREKNDAIYIYHCFCEIYCKKGEEYSMCQTKPNIYSVLIKTDSGVS